MQDGKENSLLFSLAHLQRMAMTPIVPQRAVSIGETLQYGHSWASGPPLAAVSPSNPAAASIGLELGPVLVPRKRRPPWLVPALTGLGVLAVVVASLSVVLVARLASEQQPSTAGRQLAAMSINPAVPRIGLKGQQQGARASASATPMAAPKPAVEAPASQPPTATTVDTTRQAARPSPSNAPAASPKAERATAKAAAAKPPSRSAGKAGPSKSATRQARSRRLRLRQRQKALARKRARRLKRTKRQKQRRLTAMSSTPKRTKRATAKDPLEALLDAALR